MKLILTRHGETVENVKGISQGHMHGTLTELGIEQAKKLALRLKDEKIDAIYSSDLGRSANTAKEIAKYHPDIPLIFVEELREGDLGPYAGKKLKGMDWINRPKEIESRASMCERSKKIIDKAYEEYPDGNVLFVAHQGINLALITVIYGEEPDYMEEVHKDIGKNLNTAVCVFVINEDRSHKIECMNCVKHLD